MTWTAEQQAQQRWALEATAAVLTTRLMSTKKKKKTSTTTSTKISCVPLKVLEGSKDVTYQVTNYPRISAALTPPAGHMRGKAYSTDFRRIVLNGEGTLEQRAERAGVHPSTVYRWQKRLFTEGTLDRKPFAGGRPLATTEDEDNYLRLVTLAKPDIMLDEVIQVMQEYTDRHGSSSTFLTSTISRRWQRLSFTRKVVRHLSAKRDEARRQRYWMNPPIGPRGIAGVFGVDTEEFVDIDESIVKLSSSNRTRGRSPKGERAETIGFVCAYVYLSLLRCCAARGGGRSSSSSISPSSPSFSSL